MDERRKQLRQRLKQMREGRRAGADKERVAAVAKMMGGAVGQEAVDRALGMKNAQRGMAELQRAMRKSQPKVKVVPADAEPVPAAAGEKPETRPALEDFE